MSLIRIFLVAVAILATSLSGATAAAHGDWNNGGGNDIVTPTDPSRMHAGCCDEMPDRSANCHVVPAIEPETALTALALVQSRAISFDAPWSLTGRTPSGLLDPPRRA